VGVYVGFVMRVCLSVCVYMRFEMCGFCNLCACVCVVYLSCVMCGCVYVWVL